ncbi:hypothetical protein [Pedobacter ureilyticus]|uniref:DUF2634 domain-containing protein n=1 Tax=Pedobacter ureilyticus TaxID=1393051 RepID=A0ABW9J336_9SPHI|nr:hypothetical protein [Pedobacter helvus]
MFETNDILLYENGNGGEIGIEGNDIALNDQLLQQPYLCLFGGNVEAVTNGNEPQGSLREDWWGNALFFAQETGRQFNSVTEKALKETAFNSAGRIKIMRAAELDLEPLKVWADIVVDVVISKVNEVIISIRLKQPNKQENTVNIVWDGAKQQVVKQIII